MSIYYSKHPEIHIPDDICTWDWLFESKNFSPLHSYPDEKLAGYIDADTKERLDYAEVKSASTYISTALAKNYGLGFGDTITFFSGNSIWYPTTLFSVTRLGGVVCGASPAYGVEEMSYALKTSKSKFIATVPSSIEIATEAAALAGVPREHIFILEGDSKGFKTVKDLIEEGKAFGDNSQVASVKVPEGKTNKDICGLLCFSSGTTGLPKAVMVSHHNIIAQALQVKQNTPASQKKTLAVLPFYHISGLVHALHLPVILNAEVIMLPKFSMEPMLKTVQDYQIEELLVVPPLLIRLVHDSVVDKYDLSCVKRFSSGAAPVSDEIMGLLGTKFPNRGFKNGYGMTETTSCITGFPPELFDFKYAYSVGRILPNTQFRIVNDDGTDAEPGQPGEIIAKGPQVVMGYLDNEKATKDTFDFQGGWLRTGDLGSIDADGVVTIHDRIKEMIKVKGIAVAPAELEDLLLGHESVQDVAVIGKPDDYSGELPKAFVVLKDVAKSDSEAMMKESLTKYVQERKTRYKWIKDFEFVPEIPKSASGKILRKDLRAREKESRKD